jgi:hypothetical protein
VLNLPEADHELICTPPIERESWAVITRPQESNGFGLHVHEAKAMRRSIEYVIVLLEDALQSPSVMAQPR